jgi:Lar family restriction alleviation protein
MSNGMDNRCFDCGAELVQGVCVSCNPTLSPTIHSTDTNAAGELLPCPFCGDEGHPFVQIKDGSPHARCSGCGVSSARYSTAEAAAHAWNRRASRPTSPSCEAPNETQNTLATKYADREDAALKD